MPLYSTLGTLKQTPSTKRRWASGTLTPGGSAVTVATGLSEVAFCGVSLAAAPTIDHTYSQAAPYTNPGDIRIRSYKPTATDNNAPAAVSAGEAEAVTWWAIGN